MDYILNTLPWKFGIDIIKEVLAIIFFLQKCIPGGVVVVEREY